MLESFQMAKRSNFSLILICTVLSIITNFPSGYTNSTVNTAVDSVERYIRESYYKRGTNITEGGVAIVKGAVINCWFVMMVLGAIFTPYVTDTFGRKIGYIGAISMAMFASIIQYLSILFYTPEIFILGRSLTALSSPLADACLLLYLQEISPLSIRGMASFLCEIGYGAMVVLGMVLGMTSVLGEQLDLLMILPLGPLALSLIFLAFIPETPKFLMIIKNDREKALRSLEFFRGESKDNQRLLDDYEREKLNEASQERSSLSEIFSTWNLRQAVYLASCVLFLTWSFYPMLTSSTSFFRHSNIHHTLAEMMSALLMVLFTISSICGASIVDRYPRRFLVMFSGVLSNVFLVLFAVFSIFSYSADWIKYACIAAAIAYCIAFGMVLGPVSWFVAPELVPLKHKSLVFSLCFGANNVFIAITDFLAIVLFQKYGAMVFLVLFTLPSIVCLIFAYLYLPETKGKEIEDIIKEMFKKANKSLMKKEECSKQVRPNHQVFATDSSTTVMP
ncbi:unnamed protein product [Cylicocyclus nassatus]|uniref:Major facilitator superfamily (MFS) profile domain-containing protein n=1 Tax=Cylicocyclus nassatus TaxID=53992 RepID=A0AA36MCZ3_CYLNA|nr:unnamed protein product [Cylicocyclus nassatus]